MPYDLCCHRCSAGFEVSVASPIFANSVEHPLDPFYSGAAPRVLFLEGGKALILGGHVNVNLRAESSSDAALQG